MELSLLSFRQEKPFFTSKSYLNNAQKANYFLIYILISRSVHSFSPSSPPSPPTSTPDPSLNFDFGLPALRWRLTFLLIFKQSMLMKSDGRPARRTRKGGGGETRFGFKKKTKNKKTSRNNSWESQRKGDKEMLSPGQVIEHLLGWEIKIASLGTAIGKGQWHWPCHCHIFFWVTRGYLSKNCYLVSLLLFYFFLVLSAQIPLLLSLRLCSGNLLTRYQIQAQTNNSESKQDYEGTW